VLVVVTLFGALPIYRQVASRSYLGHGSISMLERLLPGWLGKVFVLCLLGFASTDFVITMTLSAADAAQHAVENPLLEHWLHGSRTPLTIGLLALLAVVFLRGFTEAIGVATWLAIPYLVLSLVIVARGFWELVLHPEALSNWRAALAVRGDPLAVLGLAVMSFPKLALGLSGFETGVTVMPMVRGADTDPKDGPPHARIRNTHRLLTAAALIMSFFLVSSSLVTTTLIPEHEWREGGEASGRALAYLAHHYLGPVFGTLYDASTILILWFAGASAMAAMLNLVPRYLPRFGMAPHWVAFSRPLILLLFAVDVVVTVIFDSDVEAQGGAYATGVLALILSAAVAVTLALIREAREDRRTPWGAIPFALITVVFTFTFVDNVIERPDGIIISSIFITSILVLGAVSRYQRATELRVERVAWANPDSERLFETIRHRRVHLVTIKDAGGILKQRRAELAKDARNAIFTEHKNRIQKHYNVDGPFLFVHVNLATDRSLFDSSLHVRVGRVGDDYLLVASNAVAVANAVAWLSERIDPISVFLGLTQQNPMRQAIRYLVWGEGETGILVYQILLRHWAQTPEHDVRPNIYLMSESDVPNPAAGVGQNPISSGRR
jgi:hypothetical protein